MIPFSKKIILLSAFIYSCQSNQSQYDIVYVDLYSAYPINLPCKDLNSRNSKNLKHLKLNTDQISYLKNKLLNLKLLKCKVEDSRITGYIANNNDTIKFCGNPGIMNVNNSCYKVDKELRMFLEEVTDDPLAKIIRNRAK